MRIIVMVTERVSTLRALLNRLEPIKLELVGGACRIAGYEDPVV